MNIMTPGGQAIGYDAERFDMCDTHLMADIVCHF